MRYYKIKMQTTPKQKNNCEELFSIGVLNLPFKNTLKQISCSSSNFTIFQYQNPNVQKLQCHKLSILKSKLLSNLQIYEWRNKTEFPIIKTLHIELKQIYRCQTQSSISLESEYQIKNQQKNQYKQKLIQLKVYTQHCPKKMNQIYQLNINDFFYILKEALIGFERLYDRFGGFQVTQLMIGINEKGNCKVWLNQNYSLNTQAKCQQDQPSMVSKILKVLEPHIQQSRTSRKILLQLRQCQSFLSMIKKIQKLIKQYKVIISRRILCTKPKKNKQLLQQSKSTNAKNFFLSPSSIKSAKEKLQKNGKIRYSIRESIRKNSRNTDLSNRKSQKCNSIIESPITPTDIGSYKIKNSGIKSSDKTFQTNCKTLNNADTNLQTSLQGYTSNIRYKQLKIQDVFIEKRQFLSPGRFSFRNSIKNRSQKINTIEEQINVLRIRKNKQQQKDDNKQMKEENDKIVKNRKFLFHSLDFTQDDQLSSPKLQVKMSNPQQYLTPPSKHHTQTCTLSGSLIPLQTPQHPSFACTQQQMQSQFLQQLKQKVIKNNGWTSNYENLQNVPVNMQNSFQESHDDGNIETPRSVVLLQLDQIVRVKAKKSLVGEEEFLR